MSYNQHILFIQFFFIGLFFGCVNKIENPINNGQSTFISVNYPKEKFQLGNVSYIDLMASLIQRADELEISQDFDRLLHCRNLFENNQRNVALEETLFLLSDLWENRNPDVIIQEILLSEVLYQITRSYFYDRSEVFNPTCTFLENGISISKKYIESKDTLVQQVALFQLARHFDVMQGLTRSYSDYVNMLEKEELIFASTNAIKIKKEILGLKGASVVRSLSNLRIDYNLLNKHGNINDSIVIEIEKEAYEHFPFIRKGDVKQYGEFIMVTLTGIFKEAILCQNYVLANKIIEQQIGLFTSTNDYCLGDTLSLDDFPEGVFHHQSQVLGNLQVYIDSTNQVYLETLLNDLTLKVKNKLELQYIQGITSNSVALREIGKVSSFLNQDEFDKTTKILNGEKAFKNLKRNYQIYSLQNNEFIKRKKINNIDEGTILFDSLLIIENELRDIEILISKIITGDNVKKCANKINKYHSIRQRSNEVLGRNVLSDDFLSLTEIRSKLSEDEAWVSITSSPKKTTKEIYITIVTKEDVIAKKIDFLDLVSNENSFGVMLNTLENKIVKKLEWNNSETDIVNLSNFCFQNILPTNTKHIITSNIGVENSQIWELLFMKYDELNKKMLKSIRNDDFFFYSEKNQKSHVKSVFFGFAPLFERRSISLSNDQRKNALSKIRGADTRNIDSFFYSSKKYNKSSLDYNIKEIEEINKDLNGIVIKGENANEKDFITSEMKDNVIHISSHAFINKRDIYKSGIIMHGSSIGFGKYENDNILHAYEIRQMKIDAELVVLSACETGVSPKRLTNFNWSLEMAFFDAGCRNIISSLWNVDDQATHDIIIEFYKELLQGKGKAEALFSAKQSYISKHPRQNPFYWLPLVLSGDNEPVYFK